MDFQDYLKTTAEQINKLQIKYLQQQLKQAKKVSPHTTHLVEEFAKACEGGKRLRGCLVKLGYEMYGGRVSSEIIKPALSFEIFQTAILAHDDIIDKSELRRGKPTIFKALGADHYASSQTICLGDTGFFLALQLIAESQFPDQLKLKAVMSFNNTMLKTAAGQMLDIELPLLDKGVTEKDVTTISHYKTAHYTVIGPMQLGAILAGATEESLKKIEEFGRALGIAFQIQDDILGIFGDEKAVGKSVTSDTKEGKSTILSLVAFENADQTQKEFLEKHYGKGEVTDFQMDQIKEIFIKTGALDYATKKALKYVREAKKTIPKLSANQQYAQLIEQLADFLIERKV